MDAIANWLWQGCVVALATALMLRLLDRSRASARYLVCWAGLAAVLLLPIAPGAAVLPPLSGTGVAAATEPIVIVPSAWWTSGAAALALWAAWCGVSVLRVAAAVPAVRRARRRAGPVPAAIESGLTLWHGIRGNGRQARLAVSHDVRAAAVLGGADPIIAIAPHLLGRLEPCELDRIVIHEWAHVQRRDDVLLVVQLLVRVLAGWHPAVWWLDRRLDIEREMACDELVVAVSGSRKEYAACLAKLASLPPVGAAPLIAPGALSSRALPRRIAWILSSRTFVSPAITAGAVTACAAALTVLSLTAGGFRLVDAVVLPSAAFPDSGPVFEMPPPALSIVPVTGEASRAPRQEAPATLTPSRSPAPAGGARPRAGRSGEPAPLPGQDTSLRSADTPPRAQAEIASATAVRSPVFPFLAHAAPSLPDRVNVREPSETGAAPGERTDPPASDGQHSAPLQPRTSWGTAASAGVAVADRSTRAGVAAAGFFNRLGNRIADSF